MHLFTILFTALCVSAQNTALFSPKNLCATGTSTPSPPAPRFTCLPITIADVLLSGSFKKRYGMWNDMERGQQLFVLDSHELGRQPKDETRCFLRSHIAVNH